MRKASNGGHGGSGKRGRPARETDRDEMDDEHSPLERIESFGSSSSAVEPRIAHYFRGVVKIFCVHATPSFSQPWSVRPPVRSSSSGFITTGLNGERLIITNAHSVEYATLVQVRKFGSPEKVTVRVAAIAHDCDIAILRVEDDSFWKDTICLKFGDNLPFLHDAVVVVGFPVGGEQLSITAGVVSRIDHGMYSFSTREHICVQVDSAINSGNSGGPSLDPRSGKVIGVAFQSLSGEEADNIGYVVPGSVVKHVLKDFSISGKAQPFGRLGFLFQLLENPHLKASLNVPAGMGGVLVNRVVPVSRLYGKLFPNDVITACDGKDIADDGTFSFRGDERIAFGALLTSKLLDEDVTLSVLRKGAKLTIKVKLENLPDLVPHTLYEAKPQYIVHCGLVFTPLTEPFLAAMWTREWEVRAPVRFVALAYHSVVETFGQQTIILSSILSNACVVGYEPFQFDGLALLSVNDEKIVNIYGLAAALRKATGPFLRFEFTDAKVIVIPRQLSGITCKSVLDQHAIASPASADILTALSESEGAKAVDVVRANGTLVQLEKGLKLLPSASSVGAAAAAEGSGAAAAASSSSSKRSDAGNLRIARKSRD